MKTLKIVLTSFTTLSLLAFSYAQANENQTVQPSYVDSCMAKQVLMHQKVKEISADQFRSFCECTSKQLLNNLKAEQLAELKRSEKMPSWFKAAEDMATKNCLKTTPKTQA